MSERKHIEPVQDYTKAFLYSFGVLLFVVLFLIASIWGFIASLIGSWVLDRGIGIFGHVAEKRRIARGPKNW